jgi:arginine N-succinyltransferase
MFVVRPVETSDISAFEAMVAGGTPGVHTLPRTRATIAQAVECSIASFAAAPQAPSDESYLFVLETEGALAGTATIAATAGAHGTFFAFRNDVLNQVSRDLKISHNVHALSLCSDLTGHTQLSGFFLPQRRQREAAILLSRARLMFAALAPHRFAERFFASMSGLTDADGESPFWEALGRKFFQMDFLAAERLVEGARNRSFIVELMPHYPVYVPLLPLAAQQALGQVHGDGRLACGILRDEGFEADAYVDVFDGGPILQAPRKALNAFVRALPRKVAVADGHGAGERGAYLIASAREQRFRAVLAECAGPEWSDSVALDDDVLRALQTLPGDDVLCLKL